MVLAKAIVQFKHIFSVFFSHGLCFIEKVLTVVYYPTNEVYNILCIMALITATEHVQNKFASTKSIILYTVPFTNKTLISLNREPSSIKYMGYLNWFKHDHFNSIKILK